MGDCCCDRTASRAQAIMKKVPPCTSKSAFNPFLPCFLRSRSSRERLLFKRDRTTDIMRAFSLEASTVAICSSLSLVSVVRSSRVRALPCRDIRNAERARPLARHFMQRGR